MLMVDPDLRYTLTQAIWLLEQVRDGRATFEMLRNKSADKAPRKLKALSFYLSLLVLKEFRRSVKMTNPSDFERRQAVAAFIRLIGEKKSDVNENDYELLQYISYALLKPFRKQDRKGLFLCLATTQKRFEECMFTNKDSLTCL